nr:hypothetical protein DA06_30560 [Georgenia sp. SUBG003]
MQIGTFRGMAGPAGMDPEVVSTLNDAFVKMAEEETFVEVMENNSFGVRVMETEEFQEFFETPVTCTSTFLVRAHKHDR